MVSISQFISGVVLAVVVLTSSTEAALKTGDFYRPSGSWLVSGGVNATTAYRRSPCPALNALANHGYLPRDGKNITQDQFATALKDVYNVGADITAVLVGKLGTYTDLNTLSTHNFLEHDASLVHADTYFAKDPATVDAGLAVDLLARAFTNSNVTLGIAELASARVDRLANCQANNPQCTFGASQVTIAFLESSILLLGLGGNKDNQISYNHALSFLVNEKIPSDFIKSDTTLTVTQALTLSAQIKALAV